MRALGRVGRAARFTHDGGELWRFAPEDAASARTLAELGGEGIGGFESWGEDAEGAWAQRREAGATADARGRLPWRRALVIVRGVASALDASERRALSPGRIHPAGIVIEPGLWIRADALVARLVGEPAPGEIDALGQAGKWVPPEQARGAAWDAAANRYVIGLVAYWLIAGEHPFAGAGLRGALAGQAIGAPPFEPELAASLRPGVLSFVLGMIDPDPRARPPDAGAIARRCDELLARSATQAPPPAPERRKTPAGTVRRVRRAPARAWGRVAALVALVGATALAVAAGARATSEGGDPRSAVSPARSLTDARPASCAPCHAREVAEWTRSVMAHAARSPLFGALESVVEEQIGREASCPNGAGVLRASGGGVCREDRSGIAITGAGGEGWCIHCHAPAESLAATVPPWSARGGGVRRRPLRDLLGRDGLDGIGCAVCHEAIGPVESHARAAGVGGYEGNPTWTSTRTGNVFAFRPEETRGLTGIGNSGYALAPSAFFASDGAAHRRPSAAARAYARSSEACGACHDVRLFGADAIGAPERGEHFKRLRNAYSEWRAWADDEARRGRSAPTCQDCHMSLFPGVCAPGGQGGGGCPGGTHLEGRAPGELPLARIAPSSERASRVSVHGFASVDVPMARELPDAFANDATLDAFDLPLGIRARRDLLLRRALRLTLEAPRRSGGTLEVPVVIENVGAGHRVPAGFSQEREIWVELSITDATGRVLYSVGHLDAEDEDLHDKRFLRVNVEDDATDARGRPLGVFGADVEDGPDLPRWAPPPGTAGVTTFRGRGLVNLQNGFLRCVRCIGVVSAGGACLPGPGQGATRADRFEDGDYDLDTGECRSNLAGSRALFETYFPVGALDASRGVTKAPDAIVDTRSAPPGVPLRYVYSLPGGGAPGPIRVEARLLFRAFPPYLVRAFAAYEAARAARGERPSGPQVDRAMLGRLDIVELARAEARIE